MVPTFERARYALMPVRHAHDVHRFLVIRAVVVHDAQQRDVVMRRGPEHAWGVIRSPSFWMFTLSRPCPGWQGAAPTAGEHHILTMPPGRR